MTKMPTVSLTERCSLWLLWVVMVGVTLGLSFVATDTLAIKRSFLHGGVLALLALQLAQPARWRMAKDTRFILLTWVCGLFWQLLTLALSAYPAVGLDTFVNQLCYGLLFGLSLSILNSAAQIRQTLRLLFGILLLTCLFSFAQYAGLGPFDWGDFTMRRPHATFGNPVFFAGFLVMMWPLVLVNLTKISQPNLAKASQHDFESDKIKPSQGYPDKTNLAKDSQPNLAKVSQHGFESDKTNLAKASQPNLAKASQHDFESDKIKPSQGYPDKTNLAKDSQPNLAKVSQHGFESDKTNLAKASQPNLAKVSKYGFEFDILKPWQGYLLAVITLIALALTQTRMAWLVAALQTISLLLYRFSGRPRQALLSTLTATGVFALLAVLLPDLRSRFALLLDRSDWLTGERAHIWHGAWRMILEKPFFGCGPGAFETYFPLYRQPDFSQYGIAQFVDHAHNEFLEVLAEQGIAGLIFFVALVGGVAWNLRPNRSNPQSAAVLAAFGGFWLLNLVNENYRNIGAPEVLWLLAALGWRLRQKSAVATSDERFFTPPCLLRRSLLMLAIVTFLIVTKCDWDYYQSQQRLYRGDTALEAGDYQAAADFYQQMLGFAPRDPEASYKLGLCNLNLGAPEKALTIWTKLDELAPAYGEVFFYRGECHRKMGAKAAALTAYQQALRYRDDGKTNFRCGAFLLENNQPFDSAQGRPADGVIALKKSITTYLNELNHTSPNAAQQTQILDEMQLAYDLLLRYASTGDLIPFMTDLTAGIGKNHVITYLNLGRAYTRAQEFEPAIARLEEANTLFPNDPAILSNLGYLYNQTNRSPNPAVSVLKKAIQLRPDLKYKLLPELFSAYVAAGDTSAAAATLADYQQFTASHPEPGLMKRSQLLAFKYALWQKDAAQAKQIRQALLSLARQDSTLFDKIAELEAAFANQPKAH